MSEDQNSPMTCTPSDLKEEIVPQSPLSSSQPRNISEFAYERFIKWTKEQNAYDYSENVVLAYFNHVAQKMKTSALLAQYSMIKTELKIKLNVDIETYDKLNDFMKIQCKGFRPKKPGVFNKKQFDAFLRSASNSTYLAAKVIMIFGVIGSCRCNELSELNVNDIEDMGNGIVVNILNQRRKTMRSFTIVGDFYLNLYKRYCALRPLRINTSRFFLNYKEGVCQQSVMEVCKISRVPKQVASYLKLPNPSEYTGHSMRRTALTILMKKRCRTVGGFSGWLTATKRNQ